MKNVYKIFAVVAIAGFLFVLLPAKVSFAGQCSATINFQAQPNPVPQNGSLVLSGYVDMSGSVWEPPGTPNAGYCIAGTTVVKAIAVQFAGSGSLGLLAPNQIINLEPNRTIAYGFSVTIKPADRQLIKSGASFTATAKVFTSSFSQQLTASTPITVNVAASAFGTYACVASDGKYACSPTNNPTCSDVPNNACQGKTCGGLSDSGKCGQTATSPVSPTPTPTPSGGATKYIFNLENPIGVDNFQDLINIIGRWIFNLAIPIAVIVIIYAGVLMLISGGNPGQFQKGAKALWYAVIGLAIVLIGKGFVTLIQSILSLRNP